METGRYPNRLKKFRRIAGYSQKTVARILGFCDTSTLSRWEHGLSAPNIVQAFTLSRLYHILPHELYSELWNTIMSEERLLAHTESFTNQTSICPMHT